MGKYQIIQNEHGYKAIFDNETGRQMSQWYREIEAIGLLKEKSQHYSAYYNGAWVIFHIDNPNEPISQRWNWIDTHGLIEGESEYYIVANPQHQYAIFHKDNPDQPISRWWYDIKPAGLVMGRSEYYIARNENDWRYAIFHIDNPDTPISKWWSKIEKYGLLNNQSPYYLAEQNGKHAIFHKDNPDEPLSLWWSWICAQGLVKGESEYYIVQDSSGEEAIFYIDDPNEPVSYWWDNIASCGLVKGESEYYLVRRDDDQWAVFHKNNFNEPITKWHYYIYPIGLPNGTSECYAVREEDNPSIQIYHLSEPFYPLYTLSDIHKNALLYFNDEFAIYITNKYLLLYDSLTLQHQTIAPLSEDINKIVSELFDNNALDYLDQMTTNRLIAEYIHYSFLPIVFKNIDYHCYLYTLDGDYIGKFNSTEDMKQYIQQEITNKNTSCDMLRLY